MKIVVYGFYNHNNLGDDLFIKAFETLFPQHTFLFTDNLSVDIINGAPAIFIGGGSLLFDQPNISTDDIALLKTKNILYIGVGAETEIHPIHIELLKIAKLVAIRSPRFLSKMLQLNKNTICIPDIVYALHNKNGNVKIDKSVCVLNNALVVPSWDDPHWKHAAWSYFKSEFSQFLDYLTEQRYNLNFLGMSCNAELNDLHASIEIMNSMKYRKQSYLLPSIDYDLDSITRILSQYGVIITQRFHGIVLSEVCNIPYISIYHHEKLKKNMNERGNFLSYYETSKQNLIDNFNQVKHYKLFSSLIDKTAFDALKLNVNNILR